MEKMETLDAGRHVLLWLFQGRSEINSEQWTKLMHVGKKLYIFLPPNQMIGGILFLSCLFVYLSVVNFNIAITFEL